MFHESRLTDTGNDFVQEIESRKSVRNNQLRGGEN